jgi:uncharacterized protein YoxC
MSQYIIPVFLTIPVFGILVRSYQLIGKARGLLDPVSDLLQAMNETMLALKVATRQLDTLMVSVKDPSTQLIESVQDAVHELKVTTQSIDKLVVGITGPTSKLLKSADIAVVNMDNIAQSLTFQPLQRKIRSTTNSLLGILFCYKCRSDAIVHEKVNVSRES